MPTLEVYSVGDVSTYLKEIIEADTALQDLWVSGEISNLIVSSAGHCYFTLKDATSQMRCVLFRGQIRGRTAQIPRNGQSVIAHGRLSLYEPRGDYQLYVDVVQPEGVGLLYLQFAELQARLEREGLFEESRKRPLPRYPRRIGIVTSPTGAVLRDIANVIARRYPLAELILAPTLVQGDSAARGICQALRLIAEYGRVDVIVVARGGGSVEDLWPFNDESVARTIFALSVPVVSAIGHETDFTICDFVADLRAPTPSAAAELLVPDRRECQAEVAALRERLVQGAFGALTEHRQSLREETTRLGHVSPMRQIERLRQSHDDSEHTLHRAIGHHLAIEREHLTSLGLRLRVLNPSDVLRRGYAVLLDADTGRLVQSVDDASYGDRLEVRLRDGSLAVTVDEAQAS